MRFQLLLSPATGLLFALGLTPSTASTATPAVVKPAAAKTPPPFVVAPPRYDTAPEPWRSYLTKAREADAIADPMQRCLAFPPIPGSQWPRNLVPAHCEWAFGFKDFSLDTVRKYLDAGDAAGLEKVFRDLQERHFSETNFSEHIHLALALFDSSYEAGVLSKRWLELAPDSPFAMTARAEFYKAMGWAARGSAYAQETPDEQMARMKEFHEKATGLYRQALAKEPRMMHAYAGLEDMSKNGHAIDTDATFKTASKIDPACKWLLDARMTALKPRWGGSYEQMGELEQQMLPNLERRPLLALSRLWPYVDIADTLYQADKFEDAVKVLEPMRIASSHPQVYEDLGAALASIKDANRWEELAYLVAATQFRPGDGWHARERGREQLLIAHDSEMANRSLAVAAKAEPEKFYGHYLYAASFGRLGKFDEAEREYLLAMQDKADAATHRDALFELGELMLQAHRGDKARAYAKQATSEYPDEPRAWLLNWYATGMDGAPLESLLAAVEKFLAKVDPKDPRYQHQIDDAHKAVTYLRDFAKAHPEPKK